MSDDADDLLLRYCYAFASKQATGRSVPYEELEAVKAEVSAFIGELEADRARLEYVLHPMSATTRGAIDSFMHARTAVAGGGRERVG